MKRLITALILSLTLATPVAAANPHPDLCVNLDGIQHRVPDGYANTEYIIATGQWVILDYCYPLD
jgi:hypothetical protein